MTQPLAATAARLGITEDDLEPFGRDVAKVTLDILARRPRSAHSRYIGMTSMSPTPFGEGKTTLAIGLADALTRLGLRSIATLRQPSLGPTLGLKGGASGGGRAQLVPTDEVDLGLTGDIHAVEAAHNLLAACLDNHLHHGNPLALDSRSLTWRRVMDLEDRALRAVITGLGRGANGIPRETGFDITAASEVMGILTLAASLPDLRQRLGRIVTGFTRAGQLVMADDLKCAGAMAALLRHAIKPNLVQTLEHTPVLLHGAAFANLGLGNSSVIADEVALRIADVVVTECGFGADLGLEKFGNIKCRTAGLQPSCAVLVVTTRALKYHSAALGRQPTAALAARLSQEDLSLVRLGIPNLTRHIQNVRRFGLPVVVAVNRFATDSDRELALVQALALEAGADAVELADSWGSGGEGTLALAAAVLRISTPPEGVPSRFAPTYDLGLPLAAKLEAVARDFYGAGGIALSSPARRSLDAMERHGYGALPVCMAKTPLSLSHDPTLQGCPEGFLLPITEVRLAAGARYVTALCGEVSGMPGLPRTPGSETIDIDGEGRIVGLR